MKTAIFILVLKGSFDYFTKRPQYFLFWKIKQKRSQCQALLDSVIIDKGQGKEGK